MSREYRARMVVLFKEQSWEIDAVEFWSHGEKLTLRTLDGDRRVKTFEAWAHEVVFTDEVAPAIADSKLSEADALGGYYVQDMRTVVGNCASFERPGRNGYTCDLNDSGIFSKEKAESILRDGDRRMFPCALVQAVKIVHVRVEPLDRLHKELHP